ncbi:hypothetical protein [Mycobacterium sp. GA-2829]|uniref:hypothetical protein n=1 Tax=Mycobacterium sp. GA-2829 TaxID=1772283 RepID=UPI00073FB782|nr:hypothetical protein [Mycobacterium sp. GA-2829]KUI39082.1 hypothetical protein AU194_17240 [Mycobacterium sp. GA-2829]
MMRTLRRVLGHEVSVGGVLETLLWASLPYLVIGVLVVGLRAEHLHHMQTLYGSRDQLLSFGILVAGWPGVLIADVCMY